MKTIIEKALRLVVLVALAGVSVAYGALETISFRSVYFDPRDADTPVFYVNNGGARDALEIEKSRITEPRKANVRGGQAVDFFLSKEAKKDEVPAFTITLPADSTGDLLFLIVPFETSYRGRAINLPSSNFAGGGNLMINAASSEVSVVSPGATPLKLKPGAFGMLSLHTGKDEMAPIQIYERKSEAEPWGIVQSTRWAVDERFRSYTFFYRTSPTDRLKVYGITERMGAAGKKEN